MNQTIERVNSTSVPQNSHDNEYYYNINRYITWTFKFICKLISGFILISVLYCSSTYYRRTKAYHNQKIWFFPLPKKEPNLTTDAILQIVYNQTTNHVSFLCSDRRPQLWPYTKERPYCWFFVFTNESEKNLDPTQWNLSDYGYDSIIPLHCHSLIIHDTRLQIRGIENCVEHMTIVINEKKFHILAIKTRSEFNSMVKDKDQRLEGIDLIFTLETPPLILSRSCSISIQEHIKCNFITVILEKIKNLSSS